MISFKKLWKKICTKKVHQNRQTNTYSEGQKSSGLSSASGVQIPIKICS